MDRKVSKIIALSQDTSVYSDFLPEIIQQQFSANSKARKLSFRLVEMLCSCLKV